MLVGDPFLRQQLTRWHPDSDFGPLAQKAEDFRRSFRASPATAAATVRNRWIDGLVNAVVTSRAEPRGGFSATAAAISRHPMLGAPILAALLVSCFLLVVNVANRLADGMHQWFWIPLERWLVHTLPPGFWSDPANRKFYLPWLGQRLGFRDYEDWNQLLVAHIHENYGRGHLDICPDFSLAKFAAASFRHSS